MAIRIIAITALDWHEMFNRAWNTATWISAITGLNRHGLFKVARVEIATWIIAITGFDWREVFNRARIENATLIMAITGFDGLHI